MVPRESGSDTSLIVHSSNRPRMSLLFAPWRSTSRLALAGRTSWKASREVIQSRWHHMSEVKNAAAPAAVKDPSWPSVVKDMWRNGGVSIVVIAAITSLVVIANSNLVTTITSETKAGIVEANKKMDILSSATYTSIVETNNKMDTLSSETSASIVETHKKMDTLSSETSASIVEMNMNFERLSSETKASICKMNMNIEGRSSETKASIGTLSTKTHTLLSVVIGAAVLGVVSLVKK